MSSTVLLVDYGGVLTTPLSDTVVAWCRNDDIDPADVGVVLRDWHHSDGPVAALETGALPLADFERALAARLRTRSGGEVAPEGLTKRMFAGFAADPAMLDVVRAARAQGIRTGLVSNSWGMDYRRDDWPMLFDTVVISGEVGLRKPDPEIYRLAASNLEVAPEACVFVDDLAVNVRGAQAVGMVGVEHTDAGATRERLSALFATAL